MGSWLADLAPNLGGGGTSWGEMPQVVGQPVLLLIRVRGPSRVGLDRGEELKEVGCWPCPLLGKGVIRGGANEGKGCGLIRMGQAHWGQG